MTVKLRRALWASCISSLGVANGDDSYSAGFYEAAVVNENGAWRIGALDFEPTWAASHSQGWAHVADGEAARLVAAPGRDVPPPDRPLSGAAGPPFPAIADLPFHYANPVSGRPPARGAFPAEALTGVR